jgi:transcriptional regulator with XRE-family HTH domain
VKLGETQTNQQVATLCTITENNSCLNKKVPIKIRKDPVVQERVFRSERLRGLLRVKGIRADEVRGFSREMIAKWENGHGQPTLEGLRDLAVVLDAASDYLIGLGDDYGGSYDLAAAKMSFAYFYVDLDIKPELKERCRRVFDDDEVLKLPGAPRTADEWRTVARIIDLSTPRQPVPIQQARGA